MIDFHVDPFLPSPIPQRKLRRFGRHHVLMPGCYTCNCGCAIVRMTEANAIYRGGLWQDHTNDIVAASGNAGGLLLAPVYHPDGAYASRAMQATISATEAGIKLRLIPAYFDANGTQYGQKVAVEFEFGDETRCGVVRIITNPGNIEQIESEQELSVLVAARSHEVKVFYKVLNVDFPSYALVYAQVDNTVTFAATVEHFPNTQFGVEAWTSLTGTGSFGRVVEITKYPNGKDDCIEVGCAIHNGLTTYVNGEEYTSACNWDNRSGTWTFNPGVAGIEIPDVGALISYYPNWTDDDTVSLEVHVYCDQHESFVEADLIVDYVDDDNYHFVRVTGIDPALGLEVPPDSNLPSLAIYRREAGVDTLLSSNGAGDYYYVGDGLIVTVCVRSDGQITARTNTVASDTERAFYAVSDVTLHGGKRAGIRSNSVSAGTPLFFRNFAYRLAVKCGDETSPERPCSICSPCKDESGYTGKLSNGLSIFASGIDDGSGDCSSCLGLNGTTVLPPFASQDDYKENGIGETLACKTMVKGGTAPCAGTGDSGVQATLFADRIEVVYFYHFDEGGYPMHNGKFVYYLTPEEQCDLTLLENRLCEPAGVTDLVCGFQNASIHLSAV